jgi:2-amino-4-hydroxy-6-hydroxymethyldihydropteridine diphosphokinase
MARAFVALGSNLEQPHLQVQRALTELADMPKTNLVKHSSLYQSAPVGYNTQPDFINAVAEVNTSLTPMELLHVLLEIENSHGRERPFPNAPRVLDLDLLLYDDISMDTTELTLPHPRMTERGFVLLPLAEIAPDLPIANHGKASDLAKACMNQSVERIAA